MTRYITMELFIQFNGNLSNFNRFEIANQITSHFDIISSSKDKLISGFEAAHIQNTIDKLQEKVVAQLTPQNTWVNVNVAHLVVIEKYDQ